MHVIDIPPMYMQTPPSSPRRSHIQVDAPNAPMKPSRDRYTDPHRATVIEDPFDEPISNYKISFCDEEAATPPHHMRSLTKPININAPYAPRKPSRETALRNTVLDAISNYNLRLCEEEAIIADCINDHNWSPSQSYINSLIVKHSISANISKRNRISV